MTFTRCLLHCLLKAPALGSFSGSHGTRIFFFSLSDLCGFKSVWMSPGSSRRMVGSGLHVQIHSPILFFSYNDVSYQVCLNWWALKCWALEGWGGGPRSYDKMKSSHWRECVPKRSLFSDLEECAYVLSLLISLLLSFLGRLLAGLFSPSITSTLGATHITLAFLGRLEAPWTRLTSFSIPRLSWYWIKDLAGIRKKNISWSILKHSTSSLSAGSW